MHTSGNISSDEKENKYICEITRKKVFIEDTGNITVYGINMYNRNENLAMLENEHCCIDDISEDLKTVEKLVSLLTECDVYPVHLKDIVEDFIVLNSTRT